jgi:branched-subunit amino acid transport protein
MERLGIVLSAAALTYLTRIAGFRLGDRPIPPAFDRFLVYVPVAAFAALAIPSVASGAGTFPARLAGATLSALVVLRFSRLWAGLLAGMAGFWVTGLVVGVV